MFRIYTGAHCNTLTLTDYQKIEDKGDLQKSTKILRTHSDHHIKPLAMVQLPVSYKSHTIKVNFQIIHIVQENVISGDTAERLGLRISSSRANRT